MVLRNKLAESIAKEDEQIARIYVSTTYTFIAIIAVAVIILFSLVNPFLSWSTILNTPAATDAVNHVLALVVLTGFCLKLLFGLIYMDSWLPTNARRRRGQLTLLSVFYRSWRSGF